MQRFAFYFFPTSDDYEQSTVALGKLPVLWAWHVHNTRTLRREPPATSAIPSKGHENENNYGLASASSTAAAWITPGSWLGSGGEAFPRGAVADGCEPTTSGGAVALAPSTTGLFG